MSSWSSGANLGLEKELWKEEDTSRDVLLPRLLSGKSYTKDTGKFVEVVA